ncbi:MAG TPA: metal-dependent transcriptional regulator [Chitinophagaceae bacterium]|nr:metal-dependent transcriptional regulator [Chitinophagaceae bacterium]
MRLNYSSSEENYLKAIFHLQQESGTVTTNALAGKLNTRAASVTDMMKKLHGKRLLHYRPYYGFSLTAEGKRIALHIIRRHRLWEYFLAEKLQFAWDEVHGIAEELEHVSSKKLIDKLDEYLGFPSFDPHGDPIPDSKGRMERVERVSLADWPAGRPAEICHVTGQSSALLEELTQKRLGIGTQLEIKKRSSFDRSLDLKLDKGMVTVSEELARHLLVKETEYGID